MTTFTNDLRYALRQLRKSPAFGVTAVLTLALGIGVNAAMFSVIDQVLLRSVPYPHPEQLVEVSEVNEGQKTIQSSGGISLPDVQDWESRSHLFQQVGYYSFNQPTVGSIDSPQLEPQLLVSSDFLKMLGVAPMMGRGFLPGENTTARSHVLVIGNSLWRELLHSDPHAVGRTVTLNGTPYTIVGVLPASFNFQGGDGLMFSPLATDVQDLQARDSGILTVIARLNPGVSVAEATRVLNQIKRQALHDFPGKERDTRVVVQSYRDYITGSRRPALLALDGAVLAVWLIACANVAGLLLTRTSGRRREIAVRNALGAGRARLLRQFLTESLLLALAGGAVGLALAWAALNLLRHYLGQLPNVNADLIHIDAPVCAFLFALSCVSAVLFGIAPGLQAIRVPAQEGLREGGAAAGVSARQRLLRDALVTVEITLSLVLLVGAGLMIRTLYALRHAELGFQPDHVVLASLILPQHRYWFVTSGQGSGPSAVDTFYKPLLQRVRALPGVEYAGITTVRPLQPNWRFIFEIELAGRPKPVHGQAVNANARAADPAYFPAIGMRILSGRPFGPQDTPNGPRAALVNRAFERAVLPGQSALGQRFRVSDAGPYQWATIVGVVDDAKTVSAAAPAEPEAFLDLDQLGPRDDLYPILVAFRTSLVIRTRTAPESLIPTLRRIVRETNASIAFDHPETMQTVVDDSMGSQVLATRLLAIFGLGALGIAAAGIYGLLAYQVTQRTREIGLRIALGAQHGDVLWMVLRHGLVLLGIGIGAGMVLAVAGSRLISSFLYGVGAHDLATVAAGALVLAAVTLIASYIPARRAARIDPVEALRTE